MRNNLPPLPEPKPYGYIAQTEYLFTDEQMTEYGLTCRVDLIEIVRAVHKAKGRYHSQIAMCRLYDACGLENVMPEKIK